MDGSSKASRHLQGSFPLMCSVLNRCSVCKFTGGPHRYSKDELNQQDVRLCTRSPRARQTRATGWVQSLSEGSNIDQSTFKGAARVQPTPCPGMKVPSPPRLYSVSPRPYEFSRDLSPPRPLQIERPSHPLNISTMASSAPFSIIPCAGRLQSMQPFVDDDEQYAGASYSSIDSTPPDTVQPRTESRRPTASEVAEARHRDLEKRIQILAQRDRNVSESVEWKARLQHIKAAMAKDRRAREEVAEAKSNERKSAAMLKAAHMAIEASNESMREKKDGADCEIPRKSLCGQHEAPYGQKEGQQEIDVLRQQQENDQLKQRTLRELREKREDQEKHDQLDVERLKNLQQEAAKWKLLHRRQDLFEIPGKSGGSWRQMNCRQARRRQPRSMRSLRTFTISGSAPTLNQKTRTRRVGRK
jgi:hypothetical protein